MRNSFNTASYGLLTHMMAQAAGLQPGDSFGDPHPAIKAAVAV